MQLSRGGQATTIGMSKESFYGSNPLRLRVEVRGDLFSIFANGLKLLEVQDPTLGVGRVGLAAQMGVDDRFDNFRVAAIP